MSELLPCPFCGGKPKVLKRPDSLDGYFCAISCFCGGYSSCAHQFDTDADSMDIAYQKAAEKWNRRAQPEITGETSDGYHTFNELYHHRAVLFSVICNSRPELAWKSKLHHDGTMYDGMFIVGIETPDGQATYHYDIDPYWEMFSVQELPQAAEWDGHTPAQAIERIGKLIAQPENEPLTNAQRIRGMSDEELATEITKNPSIPCRMCEYYNHKLGHCDAQRDFVCVTAYAEALALDWLKQPVKEEHHEDD